MKMASSLVAAVSGVALLCARASTGQQSMLDRLAESRTLYESAEYDRALAVMDTIDSAAMSPEQRRNHAIYQALCLLALDRRPQAEAKIEGILQADPLFRPEGAAPRFVALVDDVRRRVAPGLALQHYRKGKAFFDQKEYDVAISEFTMALQLVEEAGSADPEGIANTRMLADGFRDLARQALAAARAPSSAEASTPPPPTMNPPVVIRQELPSWPKDLPMPRQLGLLDVLVSSSGDVKSATIVRGLNPVYDVMLLSAAKEWKYKPATRDGRPIAQIRRLAITVNRR
jgi:tetratricopeptide (TPR) repeat protein